ncbi:hypothetical protein BDV93DRAFT_560277 [Ceratobasidium sp. AG-I]|nr:hypothetical protein BDV93DRAFT_560277 [Ceratobasidium sp. AG-I]
MDALGGAFAAGLAAYLVSGKSPLTLSLLRMIPIKGNVYYDGISTHAVNLDVLYSSIMIIPQQPDLMSGTVHQNLDPFDEHDDAVPYAVLQSAGLHALQSEDDEGYIGLDSGKQVCLRKLPPQSLITYASSHLETCKNLESCI